MANLAETRSHNLPPEVFQKHFMAIKDAVDKHAETGQLVAAAKKAAKSSGVDMDALKFLQQLAKRDPDEA